MGGADTPRTFGYFFGREPMRGKKALSETPFTRRSAIAGGLAAIGAGACNRNDDTKEKFSEGRTAFSSLPKNPAPRADGRFKLNYAPYYGMFENLAGPEHLDQIAFAADQGFRAWADNIGHWRSPELQEQIGAALRDRDMTFGALIAVDLTLKPQLLLGSGDEDAQTYFLTSLREALPATQRLGCKSVVIIPGMRTPRLPRAYQLQFLIDVLRRAADIAEPAGLTMVIEPINSRIQAPDILLDSVRDAYLVCRAVNRPSCKVLFDVYHHQIMHGALIYDLERTWDEIGYIQVADVPGRNEPTTGEINYINIFQYLYRRGYEGVIGMEHGANLAGADGERAIIDAYRYCDSFLS